MKKHIPDEITIDLSGLAPEDREIIYNQLVRAQKFANDIPGIRGIKAGIADKLVRSFKSTQASVFAESEIIAEKVRSGKVKLLPVSPHSTDAYYIQIKTGGIYTRLEIKSIIQSEASAVDKEITNAEVQHRDRLNDEQGKPTWHKTTIVVGNSENPWPFSSMLELEDARQDRLKLINEAETRIDRLLLGSMKQTKEIKREVAPEFRQKLKEAEERSKKIEKQPLTPIKRKSVIVDTAKQASTSSESSNKTSQPPSIASAVQKASSSATQDRPQDSTVLTRLRARKPHQQLKVETPLTPISKMEKDRVTSRSKVIEKVSALSPDSRLQRKVLVTEQVTVVCPHLDMTFVLNRQSNKFTAHIKGDPKPDNQAKHERKHWDLSSSLIRKWRNSADDDGNNPLQLAIIKDEIELIHFFARPNMIEHFNKKGEYPIHLAAKSNNSECLRILMKKGATIDVVDTEGNTPLHVACMAETIENVNLLFQAGANFDTPNNSNQTPRSIIENSKNTKLKECLAKIQKAIL